MSIEWRTECKLKDFVFFSNVSIRIVSHFFPFVFFVHLTTTPATKNTNSLCIYYYYIFHPEKGIIQNRSLQPSYGWPAPSLPSQMCNVCVCALGVTVDDSWPMHRVSSQFIAWMHEPIRDIFGLFPIQLSDGRNEMVRKFCCFFFCWFCLCHVDIV